MRYSTWAAAVFHALERATQAIYGGVGLVAVAHEVGVDEPTWDDFAKREGLPRALMTAMEDLEAVGLVDFVNVSHGNTLTPEGRDRARAGLKSLMPAISGIPVTDIERSFLSRLYDRSLVSDERWGRPAVRRRRSDLPGYWA